MNRYSMGVVSISFRKYAPKEILDAMKPAGLTHIEWGSDIHAPCHDVARLEELAAWQREYGVTCSSYGTYFKLGAHSIDELSAYISAAKTLGTDILRLWCGTKSGSEMNEQERQTLLAECKAAAAIAEQQDVILCLECHRKTFTEDPRDAVWLMEQVSSPHFRMYWQPFQWQTVEENEENAKKIAPYAKHLHVFHWRGEEKLPLAEAGEEWRRYLRRFDAPRTLLLEFMPKGTLEELSAEADALRQIIGGL